MKKTLGQLRSIDLRSQWNHEAHDFTIWLAKEENIEILCDELGRDGLGEVRTSYVESVLESLEREAGRA